MKFLFYKSANRQASRTNKQGSISGLRLEELESRVMLSTVQIFAAGATGQETLQLNVDGIDVAYENVGGDAATGDFQEFVYSSEDFFYPEDISIQFSNDFYDPANGIDRNLTIDRIVVDGETIFTTSDSVFSTGTYVDGNLATGFGRGNTLHTNGRFEFGQDSNAGSDLTVFALGLQGSEEFTVTVGSELVGSFTTADRTGMNPYAISLNRTITADDVRVNFTNDLYQPETGLDRNLIVDRIVIDGVQVQTESPDVFSTGTYIEGQGIVSGNLQTEILHANGYFQYSNSGVDVTPPVVTVFEANDVTSLGESSTFITINIADDFQAVFPPGNLGTAISVIGPGGQTLPTFETFGNNQPDGSKNVAYSFRNPSGANFSSADNGTYQIFLNESTVPDQAGNFAASGVIGSFDINITNSIQEDVIPPERF